MTKPTLALVSTWNELCGIAHYSEHLKRALDPYLDITVFPCSRDTFNIRDASKQEIKIQEDRINEICDCLGNFDIVNIQYEPGMYGSTPSVIVKNISKLIRASKNKVIITFHSVGKTKNIPKREALKLLVHFKLIRLYQGFHDQWKYVWDESYKLIRKNKSKVTCIVHTKKDERFIKTFVTDKVFDTPLIYKSKSDREELCQIGGKSNLADIIPNIDGVRYIGVFGFISDYKNYITALKALRELPENYHIIICGSLHEGQLQDGLREHGFVTELVNYVDEMNKLDRRSKKSKADKKNEDKNEEDDNFISSPIFSERVHFVGSLSDDDMLCGMMMCDAVVFPYWNWYNTASGPLSLAIELNRFAIASKTSAFLELAKYYPDKIEFTDIGNYFGIKEQVLRATRTVKEEKMVNRMRWVYFDERPGSIYPDRTVETYFAAIKSLGEE